MAPHMLPEPGVGAAVGEGVGARVGAAVGATVGEAVGDGVGAVVGGGAGVDTGMQNFHPLRVTLKSDDHMILDDGVNPDGPEVPVYTFHPSIKM
eukprot:2304096-Pyramimonas_sp.AAC.1